MLLPLMCAALLAAPVPFGANRIWAWTVLEVVFFVLVSIWALTSIRHVRWAPATVRPVLMAMLIWLLYSAVYLLPLPAPVVQLLVPGVHAVYDQAFDIVAAAETRYYLTLDRETSLQAVLKYTMYGAVFLLVTALVSNRTRLKLVLFTLLVAGFAQVVMSIGAGVFLTDTFSWEFMDSHGHLRGTFVNRNHFAAFLAMAAAAGIGLSLANMKRSYPGDSFRSRLANVLDHLEATVLIPGGATALIVAGMAMSTSRGAMVSLVLALVVVLALSIISRGRRARELMLLWPLGIGVVAIVLWSGSRVFLERLVNRGLQAGERWFQWGDTRNLIFDHWLTGTGPGTYQYAFTAYKDALLRPRLYDHAHNDYLELLAEQGIVGAVLLGLVVAMVMYRVGRAFAVRRDRLVRGALFASLTGMLAMLTHAFVSFNFHIPANALYFWVLAGVGLAATHLESEARVEGSARRRRKT